MTAARRAAAHRGLTSEPELATLAADQLALDSFCALSAAVERAGVSDASLAAACADDDRSIAGAARVVLHVRATLRAAGLQQAAACARATDARRPLADLASISAALQDAEERGLRLIEAPRPVVMTFAAAETRASRILRAAASSDDRLLVSALAGEFDVAELRAAERLAGQRSLRAGLRVAGAAFRGIGSRERAIEWFDRLEEMRRCGRKKRGSLQAALEATGAATGDQLASAAEADAVWDLLDDPPTFAVRAAVLCDAMTSAQATDRVTVAPFGAGSADAILAFDDAPNDGVDIAAFARACGADPVDFATQRVRIRSRMSAAVARRLERLPLAGGELERLGRPSPETPAPVVASAMTFSASRLNTFVKCPRRFFFEYMCDAVEERSTSNAVYGKVFHTALEALHREVRVPSAWQRAEVLDELTAQLDAAFGLAHREFDSELEYAVLRLRARHVAKHYVAWLFEEAADAPLEIGDLEERHDLVLGDHRFVGYIDRVDRPPGGGPVTILDYKTGRVEEDPEEYLRLVRDGDEAQLALYYAMRRARGDEVARIALVSIRDARDRTWVLALDVAGEDGRSVRPRRDRAGVLRATCSVADLERSLDAIARRCDEITTRGFEHFAVGDDPPCSYCAYAASCRERPDDEERIFAR